MYARGLGVDQDFRLAITWLTLAKDKGNLQAKKYLANTQKKVTVKIELNKLVKISEDAAVDAIKLRDAIGLLTKVSTNFELLLRIKKLNSNISDTSGMYNVGGDSGSISDCLEDVEYFLEEVVDI